MSGVCPLDLIGPLDSSSLQTPDAFELCQVEAQEVPAGSVLWEASVPEEIPEGEGQMSALPWAPPDGGDGGVGGRRPKSHGKKRRSNSQASS